MNFQSKSAGNTINTARYIMCNPQYRAIITRSLNLFKKYNDSDVLDIDIVELKQKCLEKAIREKLTRDYGKDAFLRDFAKRVKLLKENSHFKEWCQAQGVDPYPAATHAVHLGVQKVREVVYDDIIDYGQPQLDFYPEWINPLFEEANLFKWLGNDRRALPAPRDNDNA